MAEVPPAGDGAAGSGPGPLSRLTGYQKQLDRSWLPFEAGQVIAIIDSALTVPAPDGSPAVISNQASFYSDAAATCGQCHSQASQGAMLLSQVWGGTRANAVIASFSQLSTAAGDLQQMLGDAAQLLSAWSESLKAAQDDDRSGRSALTSARASLGHSAGVMGDILGTIESVADPVAFALALVRASDGMASMAHGARSAQTDGGDTAKRMTSLASQNAGFTGAVAHVVSAAQSARDTNGFSLDSERLAAPLNNLRSAEDELSELQQRLRGPFASPVASAFGSQVAGAWPAFGAAILTSIQAASTGFSAVYHTAMTDLTAIALTEQDTTDQINATFPGS
jgi:hypothetical protein